MEVVNDERFAQRYARCLTVATGLSAGLEPVTRPSGYLRRQVPGYRVRVVSSYGYLIKTWPGRVLVSAMSAMSAMSAYAAGAAPASSSSSSGSLQTRSMKKAAAMTAMPIRTESPA